MEVSSQLHVLATLPLGRRPWYPLDRRLVGLRAILDAVMKRKEIPAPSGNEILVTQPIALLTILTELSWLN
jgi:hypothetical protein